MIGRMLVRPVEGMDLDRAPCFARGLVGSRVHAQVLERCHCEVGEHHSSRASAACGREAGQATAGAKLEHGPSTDQLARRRVGRKPARERERGRPQVATCLVRGAHVAKAVCRRLSVGMVVARHAHANTQWYSWSDEEVDDVNVIAIVCAVGIVRGAAGRSHCIERTSRVAREGRQPPRAAGFR
jgi:hypothetical protein